MAKVETIQVVDADGTGFIVINKQDYDPEIHQLFVEPDESSEGDRPALDNQPETTELESKPKTRRRSRRTRSTEE